MVQDSKKYKRWKRRRMAAYIRVAVSAPQYHRKREGRKELIIGALTAYAMTLRLSDTQVSFLLCSGPHVSSCPYSFL